MSKQIREPGVFRDTAVYLARRMVTHLCYYLSSDSRLVGDVHRNALEAARAEREALIAEIADFALERLGYDVGAPGEGRFQKTRRKARTVATGGTRGE